MDEVVSRYASALVSIAKEEQKLEQYKLAVLSIRETFQTNPELLKLLKSYFVTNENKEQVIEELTKEFGLKNLTNFVKLLVIKHKIYLFKDIASEITKGINFELDVYEGFVYSTEPLEKDKILEISRVISQKIHKKVELKNKIDERLIGGVKVVVHDHVFDGSIKYKLETMKEQLKERRNG